MAHYNVEIKARCENHDSIRDFLKASGAEFHGLDHQIDTYFRVNTGRLKLREGNIENYLIYYERDYNAGPKKSRISLAPINSNSGIKDILLRALETLVIVDKQREIYFIDNVKFHLDSVKGLGKFLEIEATDCQGNIGLETLARQCRNYITLLRISSEDMIRSSYSDLLLDSKSANVGSLLC